MRAYQTGIKRFLEQQSMAIEKLDYMKRGIVVGSVKDMLLAFGGDMLSVTVMCLMHASVAANQAMEKESLVVISQDNFSKDFFKGS